MRTFTVNTLAGKGIVKKFSKTVASIQSRFVRSNLRGICGISDAQIGAGQAHGGAEESTDFKVFDQAQPAASTYIPKSGPLSTLQASVNEDPPHAITHFLVK